MSERILWGVRESSTLTAVVEHAGRPGDVARDGSNGKRQEKHGAAA